MQSNLFSPAQVHIQAIVVQQMAATIQAIESIVNLPAYQEQVLQWAPEIAQHKVKSHGVFLSYDFHLTPAGVKLIEINTNAGGALFNANLRRQHALNNPDYHELKNIFFNMFMQEWQLQNPHQPLRTIAIIDHDPQAQFLYPEFLLFQELFIEHGITTVIADPRELCIKNEKLCHKNLTIDLVYNRLTDFFFTSEHNTLLRQAYLLNIAAITPHPHAYALYANKYNLTALTNAELLRSWQVPEACIETLIQNIPYTFIVDHMHAETLWARRNKLFFKPATGFGSKGSYRGNKLTRGVFQEILTAGNYIAQELALPSEETVILNGIAKKLKVDLRCFVYHGKIQMLAARLYQGQTTNFRTPGGGFAAVLVT